MYVECAQALLQLESRLDQLRSLDVPTLVIVGDEDRVFLPGSRELAAAIPGAELVVVPTAGHNPHLETPEVWFDTVTSFLDRHRGPA
jgi:pimeloyl-ACP methyl ester carboxylesterase